MLAKLPTRKNTSRYAQTKHLDAWEGLVRCEEGEASVFKTGGWPIACSRAEMEDWPQCGSREGELRGS